MSKIIQKKATSKCFFRLIREGVMSFLLSAKRLAFTVQGCSWEDLCASDLPRSPFSFHLRIIVVKGRILRWSVTKRESRFLFSTWPSFPRIWAQSPLLSKHISKFMMAFYRASTDETPLPPPDMSLSRSSFTNLSFTSSISEVASRDPSLPSRTWATCSGAGRAQNRSTGCQ